MHFDGGPPQQSPQSFALHQKNNGKSYTRLVVLKKHMQQLIWSIPRFPSRNFAIFEQTVLGLRLFICRERNRVSDKSHHPTRRTRVMKLPKWNEHTGQCPSGLDGQPVIFQRDPRFGNCASDELFHQIKGGRQFPFLTEAKQSQPTKTNQQNSTNKKSTNKRQPTKS